MFSTPVLRDWANDLKTAGKPYPDVYFDSTTNNTDCLGQIADPSKGGHQLDNWNRTWNMATFFASKIDTTDCSTASHRNMTTESSLKVFPNPASNRLLIESSSPLQSINVLNHLGQAVLTQENIHTSNPSIDISSLPNGMYFIRCNQDNFYLHQSFIKQSK
jgi:hypothetical protein